MTGVAKNMLDFCRWTRALNQKLHESPTATTIATSIITFDRGSGSAARAERGASQTNGSGSPVAEGESPNEFVRVARASGVEVDCIDERFRFDLRVIPALRRIIDERAPDIVLTHNLKSHFLMRLSGLPRRYPWVAYHHGYTTTDIKMRAYNYLNRWSLPAADRVITVCHAFARELEREGVAPERISVQHNSIEVAPPAPPSAIEAVRARFGIRRGERIVLSVGRFSREKAHVDLVAAFGHLRRIHPEINARLVIVGDGPERRLIEEAVDAHDIRERVVLTGQLSDVNPFYAMADVLALPSHSEGSPYVLLEGMAANLPIVATAVGGVPEIIEDRESGLLVAPRSPQALAEAIGRVLSDPQLARRLTAHASTLVATRYSPEAYVASLAEIYRELLRSAAATVPQAV